MLTAERGHAGPTVSGLDKEGGADLRDGAADLTDQAIEVEKYLFDVNLTGAREDAFRNPNKLYGRLSALLFEVSVASDDHPPTDQQREVFEVLQERLENARTAYRELLQNDLPAYRSRLRQVSIPFSLSAGEGS
jgi:hypothetical protein